jgi:hypothetical protein
MKISVYEAGINLNLTHGMRKSAPPLLSQHKLAFSEYPDIDKIVFDIIIHKTFLYALLHNMFRLMFSFHNVLIIMIITNNNDNSVQLLVSCLADTSILKMEVT